MVLLFGVDRHGFIGRHGEVHPARQGVPGFQVELFHLRVARVLVGKEELGGLWQKQNIVMLSPHPIRSQPLQNVILGLGKPKSRGTHPIPY